MENPVVGEQKKEKFVPVMEIKINVIFIKGEKNDYCSGSSIRFDWLYYGKTR